MSSQVVLRAPSAGAPQTNGLCTRQPHPIQLRSGAARSGSALSALRRNLAVSCVTDEEGKLALRRVCWMARHRAAQSCQRRAASGKTPSPHLPPRLVSLTWLLRAAAGADTLRTLTLPDKKLCPRKIMSEAAFGLLRLLRCVQRATRAPEPAELRLNTRPRNADSHCSGQHLCARRGVITQARRLVFCFIPIWWRW